MVEDGFCAGFGDLVDDTTSKFSAAVRVAAATGEGHAVEVASGIANQPTPGVVAVFGEWFEGVDDGFCTAPVNCEDYAGLLNATVVGGAVDSAIRAKTQARSGCGSVGTAREVVDDVLFAGGAQHPNSSAPVVVAGVP